MTNEIKTSGDPSQAAPSTSSLPPQSQQNQSSPDKSATSGSPSVAKDESKPEISATPSTDSSKK